MTEAAIRPKPTGGNEMENVFGSIEVMGKLIGAGLAMIGAIGAGAGIGIVTSGAVQAMGRNPDAAGTIQTNMILGIAFAEAVAIYCLVVALLLLFVF